MLTSPSKILSIRIPINFSSIFSIKKFKSNNMKKLFSAVLVGSLLIACADDSNKAADSTTITEPATISNDSIMLMNADTIKTAADKRAKDSAEAAHGHSH